MIARSSNGACVAFQRMLLWCKPVPSLPHRLSYIGLWYYIPSAWHHPPRHPQNLLFGRGLVVPLLTHPLPFCPALLFQDHLTGEVAKPPITMLISDFDWETKRVKANRVLRYEKMGKSPAEVPQKKLNRSVGLGLEAEA